MSLVTAVFGPTGATGRHVVRQALESGAFTTVLAVVRREIDEEERVRLWGERADDVITIMIDHLDKYDGSEPDLLRGELLDKLFKAKCLEPCGKPPCCKGVDCIFYCLGTTLNQAGSTDLFRAIDLGILQVLCGLLKEIGSLTKGVALRRFDLVSASNASRRVPLRIHPYPQTKYDCEQTVCPEFDPGDVETDTQGCPPIASRPIASSVVIWQPPMLNRGDDSRGGEAFASRWFSWFIPSISVEKLGLAMVKDCAVELSTMDSLGESFGGMRINCLRDMERIINS